MIRWYRRPRPRATATVLLARVIGGLLVIGLYVAFRLPELTSATEAAATWVGAVLCLALILPAVERLYTDRRDHLAPGEPSPLELTEQFEVPLGWPGGVENAIAVARHEAMTPLIDRGEVVEPRLFTHEFESLHHTPPRGFLAVTAAHLEDDHGLVANYHAAKRELFRHLYTPPQHDESREPAADLIRRIRAERPSPTGRVVVSHTAPVEIARDRFGQFFGSY